MRLVRHGAIGKEKPGLVDDDDRVRDLSAHVDDIGPATLMPGELARLRQIDPAGLPLMPSSTRLGPPVAGISKLVCIGLNYADHAAELGLAIPTEPTIFLKPSTAIAGPFDPLQVPPGSRKLDYEVELALVIGTPAKRVGEQAAMEHVAGYMLANDVTERDWSQNQSGQWVRGKCGDGFAPLGPWLVTRDEIQQPQALPIWLEVDGKRLQDGTTATMIFGVGKIVSFISQYMTLLPGDVVLTGTPPGVGHGRRPPFYLRAGMEVRAGIAGLGEMRLPVVDE